MGFSASFSTIVATGAMKFWLYNKAFVILVTCRVGDVTFSILQIRRFSNSTDFNNFLNSLIDEALKHDDQSVVRP